MKFNVNHGLSHALVFVAASSAKEVPVERPVLIEEVNDAVEKTQHKASGMALTNLVAFGFMG